ncbi:hypothetical protein [Deinococcus cellulosilyticus]|uniref:Uncharacterized protein n=1 Tax=Deinococcus cellulosilyticus (strain DSM 18568 / NBRC 106333 / KACC 11606 / 5516J-15) TaxID=1223518 RepID=A0A511NA37_DEIC1|nr:hypothetical protein [Deinococcus cellulosilyticus]GEM49437.1 hypothetical protein DC3_50720 [Deinococcus cellulosilyticus NBRC 106333 = KACC 11606]
MEAEPCLSLLVLTGHPTVIIGDNGAYLHLDTDGGDPGLFLRTPISLKLQQKIKPLLDGRVKVQYFLHTHNDGRVHHHLTRPFRIQAHPDGEALNQVIVRGKVVQMNKCDMHAVVRIFSEQLREPFVVHAHGENDMLNAALDFWAVKVSGQVQGDLRVVAQRIEQARVVIPEKFRGWKPDLSWRKAFIPAAGTETSG